MGVKRGEDEQGRALESHTKVATVANIVLAVCASAYKFMTRIDL